MPNRNGRRSLSWIWTCGGYVRRFSSSRYAPRHSTPIREITEAQDAIELFEIKESAIPHRDYSHIGRIGAGGWYGR